MQKQTVWIHWLDERDKVQQGELVSPWRVEDHELVIDLIGDNEMIVMGVVARDLTHLLIRVHASQVSATKVIDQGFAFGLELPAKPVMFDQDAEN